jgi:6-phosphogluconolactonase
MKSNLPSFFSFIFGSLENNSFNLLIGTYTKGCDSKGMYVYDFDSDTGDFKKCF